LATCGDGVDWFLRLVQRQAITTGEVTPQAGFNHRARGMLSLSTMTFSIRPALPQDVSGVVELIQAYAAEVFNEPASVTAEALLADGFGTVLEFLLIETLAGELAGFAAWEKTYDVLAGARGGALLAFFVTPTERGGGYGEALLNSVASEVRAISGTFLTGFGLDRSELSNPAPANQSLVGTGPGIERLRSAADLSLSALTILNLGLKSLLPKH
jgi:GNAT superfamily N-acetyltransferase